MLPGLTPDITSLKNSLTDEEIAELEKARTEAQQAYLESIRPQMEEIDSVLAYVDENNLHETITTEWGGALAALTQQITVEMSEDGYSEQYLNVAFKDFVTVLLQGFILGLTMGKGIIPSSPKPVEEEDALLSLLD